MKTQNNNRPEKSLFIEILTALAEYIRTQLLLLVIVTLFTGLLLSYLNIRFAPLLAVLTGVLSVIPGLGMTIASIITAITAVFDGQKSPFMINPVMEGVVVLVLYFLLNLITDYLLTPHLMGNMTGLKYSQIIMVMIIGMWLFGLAGAVLAVPIFIVIRTVIHHIRNTKRLT